MSKQLFQNLLDDFKKSNQNRKLKLAIKAGYPSIELYKNYLEQELLSNSVQTVIPDKLKEKPIIHIVDIIDCSDSMNGHKIKSAIEGINRGIDNLKKDKTVDYTYTLCDFSSRYNISFKYTKCPLSAVNSVYLTSRGKTALYDAIGMTLDKIKLSKKPDEKVLVNIYTDGDENDSEIYTSDSLNILITMLKSDGFTITFIGIVKDINSIIKKLNIHDSNTLAYDGSAKGLEMSLEKTITARKRYSKSVVDGEDVSTGFYKNIK